MLSITSIEKHCRICIKTSESYSSIYDKYMLNDSRLFEVINDVCQLDINVDDGLPDFICYDCHIKIAEFQIFKRTSHEGKAVLLYLKEKFEKVCEASENHLPVTDKEAEIPKGTPSLVNLKTEEMNDYTNLNSWISSGGMHNEEASESCTEIDLIPIKLEYEDPITTDEYGAVDPLRQEVSAAVENTSVLNVSRANIAKGIPSLVNVGNEEMFDGTNLSRLTSVGGTFTEESNEIYTRGMSEATENNSVLNVNEAEIGKGIQTLFHVVNEEETTVCSSNPTCVEEVYKMQPNVILPMENTCLRILSNQQDRQKTERPGGNRFVCEDFDKKFSSKFNLVKYKRFHSGEKSFVYDKGDKKFSFKSTLLKHKSVHSGEKSCMSEQCDKMSSQCSNLERDKGVNSRDKPFTCEECGKIFIRWLNLLMHKRVHTVEKPFGCDVCDKKFSVESALIKHTMVHNGEKSFECDNCGKIFRQKIHLENHTRVSRKNPHICDKNFSVNSSIVLYKRVNRGVKPFACDVCDKKFSLKYSLVLHKRIHSGEKLFECDECDKKFIQRSSLVSHKRVHCREKPFACDVCDKKFAFKARLVRHKRVHIREKPFACDECEIKFRYKSNLVKHKRVHI